MNIGNGDGIGRRGGGGVDANDSGDEGSDKFKMVVLRETREQWRGREGIGVGMIEMTPMKGVVTKEGSGKAIVEGDGQAAATLYKPQTHEGVAHPQQSLRPLQA